MFKQSLALAALAFAVAAPVSADSTTPLNALGGLSKFGRDATRVYVLRTVRPMLPVLNRFQFGREVSGSPTQPFPPLPGLSGASFGPVVQGGIETLKVSVPLTSTSVFLPSGTTLGVKTTTVSRDISSALILKPSVGTLKGLSMNGNLASLPGGISAIPQLVATGVGLPKTGAVVIASTAGSLTALPKTGAAVLGSALP